MHNQRGQALLLVMLTMGVIVIIALSVASRSITDISTTTIEESSLRAFSAAEAGIEEALLSGISGGLNNVVSDTGLPNETSYNVTSALFPTDRSRLEYNYPFKLTNGEIATIWFMEHDASGNLTCSGSSCFTGDRVTLCWGDVTGSKNASTTPAAEVSVIYREGGIVKTARGMFDPNASRRASNNFSITSPAFDTSPCPVDGVDYLTGRAMQFDTVFGIPLTVSSTPGGLIMMRVRMLYNSASQAFGARAAVGLPIPSQGVQIDSTGTSGTVNRKVQVFNLYQALPDIFDSVLYSRSSMNHL